MVGLLWSVMIHVTQYLAVGVTLLSFLPVETPCLSPACQWASARLAVSADPFARPCDYFLTTCGSDRLSSNSGGRQRGQDIDGRPQNEKEKVTRPQGRAQVKERDRGLTEEKILDRKSALLVFLRELLGTSLQPNCSNAHHKSSWLLDRRVYYISALCDFFLIGLSESNSSLGGAALQKARGFYHSCLDTKSIETAGAEPFLTLIQKVR